MKIKERRGKLGRTPLGSAARRGGPHSKSTSKLNERTENVYENKGALWKSRGEAGIYLKTNDLSANCGNVIENKGG
jgi:hypothetical protein